MDIYAMKPDKGDKLATKITRHNPNKPWKCQECGKLHSQRTAERIVNGNKRCACGGTDIDLA